MRVPSTTEPHFVLCDEHADLPEAEKSVFRFPFASLADALQALVIAQLDMASRCSFGWTCRRYLKSYGERDFDPFAFADKCAELGYRTLLKDSVDRGGPFDVETSRVAAAYGQLDVLRYFVKRVYQKPLLVDFEKVHRFVTDWAEAAAKTGNLRVLEWVKIEQWRDFNSLERVATKAMEHAPGTALKILEQVKRQFDHSSCGYGGMLATQVARIAYRRGHLEVVQRMWEMGHSFDIFFNSRPHPSIAAWYIARNSTEVRDWLPQLLDAGIKSGIVELIELAEQHGATIAVDNLRLGDYLPPLNVLRYIHRKFNLPRAPFNGTYPIPYGTTKDDLQWLLEQGYRFKNTGLFPLYLNVEWLSDLFQIGFRPTRADLLRVAYRYRFDLLDAFWQARTEDDLKPDSSTIAQWIETQDWSLVTKRFRLKPRLKIIQWFRDKGFTYGAETAPYDKFISSLLDRKPRLFRDYHEEITALNMPFSTEVSERIEAALQQKDP